MPIYEYKCERGHVFDAMQRMSDDPLTTCEQCEAPVRRVFHPVAVHFKGSGFYNTDYGTRRRSRETTESSAGKPAESGKPKDGEKSSDSGKASTAKASESKKSDSSAAAA